MPKILEEFEKILGQRKTAKEDIVLSWYNRKARESLCSLLHLIDLRNIELTDIEESGCGASDNSC